MILLTPQRDSKTNSGKKHTSCAAFSTGGKRKNEKKKKNTLGQLTKEQYY